MNNRSIRGKTSVMSGILAFSAAALMFITCVIIFAVKYTESYLESLMTDYITETLVSYLLYIGAASMFIIGGIRYIKGHRPHGILAVGGIMLFGIGMTAVVMSAIIASDAEFIGAEYVIETLMRNSMTLLVGVFILIFSLIKIRGSAILFAGYAISGIYLTTELIGTIGYLFGDVNIWALDDSAAGIIYTAFDGIAPLITAVGIILSIPFSMYISKGNTPVYTYAPYSAQPVMNPQFMTNTDPVCPPQPRPMAQQYVQYRPRYQQRCQQPFAGNWSRPSVFNQVFLGNQKIVTDFLEAHGYTVRADEESLTVTKGEATTGIQSDTDTFVAKSDGIYNFVEVFMGGYDLRKRLSCPNPQTARMILLSKYVMEAVKSEGDISAFPELRKVLSVLASYEDSIAYHFSRTPNFRNMYILEDYFDLIEIKRKIYFMR